MEITTGIKVINTTLEAIVVMQTLSQRFSKVFGQRPSSPNLDPGALSALIPILPFELQQHIVSYFTHIELARLLLAGFHSTVEHRQLFQLVLCQYEATKIEQTIISRRFNVRINGTISCVQLEVGLIFYDELRKTTASYALPGIYRRLHAAESIIRPPLHPKVPCFCVSL